VPEVRDSLDGAALTAAQAELLGAPERAVERRARAQAGEQEPRPAELRSRFSASMTWPLGSTRAAIATPTAATAARPPGTRATCSSSTRRIASTPSWAGVFTLRRRTSRPLRTSRATDAILPPPTSKATTSRFMPNVGAMRYSVLATDYDGTLAQDGRVDEPTAAAVEGLRRSGRRLVLVTGRLRADLERVFPRVALFDLVVAENGGTLWRPGGEEVPLAPSPPAAFLEALRARGVPFDAGHVVVATREPHEREVLAAIHAHGLDLQLAFNKGAVMVLPPGVTKASGLDAALTALRAERRDVVAVGDAENDLALLAASGYAVAVANALPSVKRAADLVTRGARGAGFVELAEALLADDAAVAGREQRPPAATADPPRR
jgi:hydroxymethylpyrimidine pyrophosphatase-like HAD family hydrolase